MTTSKIPGWGRPGLKQEADQPGIEQLRKAVNYFDNTAEWFNAEHTALELLNIYRAYKLSEWDQTPDEWPDDAVDLAKKGAISEAARAINEHFGNECEDCGAPGAHFSGMCEDCHAHHVEMIEP